jgi:hypothetical protein
VRVGLYENKVLRRMFDIKEQEAQNYIRRNFVF